MSYLYEVSLPSWLEKGRAPIVCSSWKEACEVRLQLQLDQAERELTRLAREGRDVFDGIVRFLKNRINPFLVFWEVHLSKGVLRALQSYVERKRERKQHFAQKEMAAKEEQQKKRVKVLIPLIRAARVALRLQAAKEQMQQELLESERAPTQRELSSSRVLFEKWEKKFSYYSQLKARSREERARRTLQRKELQEREAQLGWQGNYCQGEVETGFPTTLALESLAPDLGLGAKRANPICRIIVSAIKMGAARPILAAEIMALAIGRAREWEHLHLLPPFVENLFFLVQYYPEEALAEELKAIRTSVLLQEASSAVAEEKEKLQNLISSSNLRAGYFHKFASRVASAAKTLKDSFMSGCEEAGTRMAEGVFSVVMRVFDSVLGQVKHEMHVAASIMEVMVGRVKSWYMSMVAKVHHTLAILGKYACYGLGLLLGLGLVTLIANILGTGVHATLISIFCTGLLAAFAIKAGAFGGFHRQMLQSISILAQSMFGNPNPTPRADGYSNLRANSLIEQVISGMTAFGTGLAGFSGQSLVQIGKLGAAFHQMKMGKEALKEFATVIMGYLGKCADTITGRESLFFDELSTMLQIDVKGWIKKARHCVEASYYEDPGSEAFKLVVSRLLHDGQRLQIGLNGLPRSLSTDYGTLVATVLRDLKEVHKKGIRAGSANGKRREPFWVYLFGPSHCGKSLCMDAIGMALCKKFDLPYTTTGRNPVDAFFSGYNQQTIVEMDDLSSVVTTPPMEAELIKIVSCKDYPLNMADVEDKPIYFNSPFIISSSNFEDVPAAAGVRDITAYRNRKGCLIEMRRKPGVAFNAEDSTLSSQFAFKDPLTQMWLYQLRDENGRIIPDSQWVDVAEGITIILEKAAVHWETQDKIMAKFYRDKLAVDPLMLSSSAVLKKEVSKAFLEFPLIELEKAGVELESTGFSPRGLYVDKRLFLLQSDFSLKEFPLPSNETPSKCAKEIEYRRELCNYDAVWKQRMQKIFLPRVASENYLNHSSITVSGFLRSLTYGDCSVLSPEELTSTASGIQERVFAAFDLQERVYLRALQIAIDSYREETGFNVYTDSFWAKVVVGLAESRDIIVNNGGGLLMIAAAMLIFIAFGWGFWKLFVGLFTGSMTLAHALSHADAVEVKAQQQSGSQPKGGRARNVPMGTRYSYLRASDNSVLPAANLCVAMFGPRGVFVSAMQYKGKAVMLTRHQSKFFQEGDEVTCDFISSGERKTFRWRTDHIREMPQSEIVLWMAPNLPQLPCQYSDLFLEDAETDLPNDFKMMGYVLWRTNKEDYRRDERDLYARVLKVPLKLTGTVGGERYEHEVPAKIQFHYVARDHDCGMLILCQIGGKMKVVGLLVAGEGPLSWACILPNPHLVPMKAELIYEPGIEMVEDGFAQMGQLTPDVAPTMPKKNNMVMVPISLQVPCAEEVKMPAILTKENPLCPAGLDPPVDAFKKKFSKPMDLLEQNLVDEVCGEILETWYDCESGPLQDISLETAINGVPLGQEQQEMESFVLSTSPGYPYYMEKHPVGSGKGKQPYFEQLEDGKMGIKKGSLADELYKNLEEVSRERVPQLVTIECPKDEILPKRKFGQCRLFEILPLHYNLLLRVKTYALVEFLSNNRHKLPCQVGINPYSREWSHLYQRLLSKNDKAINCDFKAFDGLMTSQLLEAIAKMINAMYQRNGESERSRAQRFNLIMALHGRYALLGRKVMRVNAGIPSGFSLTVIVNSVLNEFLMRYAFKIVVPPVARNRFTELVCLVDYGDDNVSTRKEEVAATYTGENIRKTLATVGVTITDGTDKDASTIEEKEFSQLDFLKRKFRLTESGVVTGPLDRSAIFSSLYWITPSRVKFHASQKACDYSGEVDVVEELLLNVNVALVELYLHGDREEFERVRQFYIRRIPHCVDNMRTWAYCESFHSTQQTGMLKHDPVSVRDHLVDQRFVKFMHCSAEGKSAHMYMDQLGVCGPFYKAQEGDYIVSTQMLRVGESGQHIPLEVGYGAGGLPTKSWVKKFTSPTLLKNAQGYRCLEAITGALEAGQRILFRSEAPYVAGNAALISFAVGQRLGDQRELLIHYRNSIPEGVNGLGAYFDSPVPLAETTSKFYFANEETFAALNDYKVGEVLNIEEATVVQTLNRAVREGKFPVMAATRQKTKCVVAMACSNRMCPHHKVSKETFLAAFEQCWLSRCKSMGNATSKFSGTKLGAEITKDK
uniref:RNA1 polyprotein n=1 Tax=Yunnan pine nepovirus TaxID=3115771 RepID=A0AAT9JHL6_9SECO